MPRREWDGKPPWVEEAREIYESNEEMSWSDVRDIIEEKYPDTYPKGKSTLYRKVKKYSSSNGEGGKQDNKKEPKKAEQQQVKKQEQNNEQRDRSIVEGNNRDGFPSIDERTGKILVLAIGLFGILLIIIGVL